MSNLLIFIESSGSGAGEATARAALDMGMVPVVLASNPDAYPFFQKMGVEMIRTDTWSRDGIMAACARARAEHTLAGVGTTAEYFTEVAAEIAHSLGFPGPDPEAVAICRSKDRMRKALDRYPALNPLFRVAETPEQAAEAACSIGFPVILKPVSLTGSTFVRLCADRETVAEHTRGLLLKDSVDGMKMPRRVLLEEYVEGPEFSVEVFEGRSLGVTKKRLGPPPYFIEVGHDFPAELSDSDCAAVADAALKAVEASGLFRGPAHIEIKLGAEGPRVIEVNPRMAGGRIPFLIQYATGIDFARAYIKSLTGEKIIFTRTANRVASIRFITVTENARLEAVLGLDAVRNMPGVEQARFTGEIGREYRVLNSNGDRIGFVIAVGDTMAESAGRAELAIGGIRLQWASK